MTLVSYVIKYVEWEVVKDLEDDGMSELLNLKDMINEIHLERQSK